MRIYGTNIPSLSAAMGYLWNGTHSSLQHDESGNEFLQYMEDIRRF